MRIWSNALACVIVLIGTPALVEAAHNGRIDAPKDQSMVWPTVPMDSDAQRSSIERLATLSAKPESTALNFRVTIHNLLVDVPSREAVVDLRFSEVPDLQSFDEFGRQSHSFQYFVSEPNWAAFYARTGGGPETNFPLLVIRGEEIHTSGQVPIREVEPLYDCSNDPGCGGWGPKVAAAPVYQDGKRVLFKFPISVFDSPDGAQPYVGALGFAVHYFLELYQFGATTGGVVQGIARIATVNARIDVKPGDPDNAIDPRRPGRLVVDVPTTLATRGDPYSFYADTIIVPTLELGPNRSHPLRTQLQDVNGDGAVDLRLTFQISGLGLSCIDQEVRLTGEIPDLAQGSTRSLFVGRAPIRVAECP